MKKLLSVFATLLHIFLHATVAFAASFDCSKAETETEIAICEKSALSTADELIAATFRTLESLNGESENLLIEQRDWLKERDAILSQFQRGAEEYLSGEENLYDVMSLRLSVLLSELIGADFDVVINIISSSATVSYATDVNKRVIIYSLFGKDSSTFNNALFFNKDRKLAKVLKGEIYGHASACEEQFYLYETNRAEHDLAYTMSCGSSGRHGWTETSYNLRDECIGINSYGRHPGQISDWTGEYYEFLNKNATCIENFNYDFDASIPQIVTWNNVNLKRVDNNLTSRLLKFVTDYWLDPPITDLHSIEKTENKNCNTGRLALTRIKLINLYQHFTLSDGQEASQELRYPRKYHYILRDAWNWDFNFVQIIKFYENNTATLDGFLPLVKLLDDDGSISEIVHFLIASRSDPELKIYKFEGEPGEYFPQNCATAKHESAVPYFAAKKEDLVAKIGIEDPMEPYNLDSKLRSFWERREADGTAEITWSILMKLRNQLN